MILAVSMLYTSDAPGESLHQVLHDLAPQADYDEHGMVKFARGKPNLVPELLLGWREGQIHRGRSI